MGRKAVFLDRDGVINPSLGKRPPNSVEEFRVFPYVGEAIRNLNEAGYLVFVVTNQGGVGLGHMTAETLGEIHGHLTKVLEEDEAYLTEIRACTHRPKEGCACRKPAPGMILDLAQTYEVDVQESYMVGDRDVDMFAGKRAHTKTIFVGSHTEEVEADFQCRDLKDAVALILKLCPVDA